MKKLIVSIMALVALSSMAFAAPFAPTVMEITTPAEIAYQFDGSNVDVPITVSGVGGSFWLVVMTKDMGDTMPWVQNGYRGWHIVNGIDTTLYVSGVNVFDTGANTITWNGKDQDGTTVDAEDVNFMIYGYDHANARQPASMFICIGNGWENRASYVIDSVAGADLEQPVLTATVLWHNCAYRPEPAEGLEWKRHGNLLRWTVGGDPDVVDNLETTLIIDIPTHANYTGNYPASLQNCAHIMDPNDLNVVYNIFTNHESSVNTMHKFDWNTGGNAIEYDGWSDIEWEANITGPGNGMWTVSPSTHTDGEYIYVSDSDQTGNSPTLHWTYLRVVNFDGEELVSTNMNDFFFPDDPNSGGAVNCANHDMDWDPRAGHEREWFQGTMGCCMHQMIDTTQILELGEEPDDADYILWRNGNGDFFMDVFYQPDSDFPWACLSNEEQNAHRFDTVDITDAGFVIQWASFLGSVSFGVQAPDGTPLGMMAYADDNVDGNGAYRGGGHVADSGSNYDGMYMNENVQDGAGKHATYHTYYVPYDSAAGVLTKNVAVEEEAAAAFTVAQNTPNPFNPTTSINFTLAQEGNVTVDVFNVAGQKVDTLVNEFMGVGQHQVTWDAAGVSAGVYFYTVKSGDFSKTMKMTLLK